MRAWFEGLTRPAQLAAIVVVAVVAVALLLLFYDWLGGTLLDSGGMVG